MNVCVCLRGRGREIERTRGWGKREGGETEGVRNHTFQFQDGTVKSVKLLIEITTAELQQNFVSYSFENKSPLSEMADIFFFFCIFEKYIDIQ